LTEEQQMASLRFTLPAALAAAAALWAAAPAPAQQRAGGAPNNARPADPGAGGRQISRVYIRYYPYWARYPHAGFDSPFPGTGFDQGPDFYGFPPTPSYPRLITIPPPPPPPLPKWPFAKKD
jgi:hypothetical protein